MDFILKSKCPICGHENEAPANITASASRSAVTAKFNCIGPAGEGCKTEYKISACGKTAEGLAQKLGFVKDWGVEKLKRNIEIEFFNTQIISNVSENPKKYRYKKTGEIYNGQIYINGECCTDGHGNEVVYGS